MQEKSFRRAALFGVLGALVFLVIALVLVGIFPGLKKTLLFRTDHINFDLVVIAIRVRISLFVIIGFVAGWAFCLFKGSPVHRSKSSQKG